MMKLSIIEQLKNFFGFMNSTKFEQELIERLKTSLDIDALDAVEDQLRRFNRVVRLLDGGDSRLKFGSTRFYWIKSGKHLFDKFPKKIPMVSKDGKEAFFQCLIEDSSGNKIRIDYWAEYGAFVQMKYFSENRIWYPVGCYSFIECKDLRIKGD